MPPTRMLPRTLGALLALASLVTAAAVLVGVSARKPGAPRPALVSTGLAPRDGVDPMAVLHGWDVRRARAWATGDRQALRELYVPGSTAGRRDVAMLAAWHERGLRVQGMRMQLLAAQVRAGSTDRLVVAVTDRLAGGVAVGPATRLPLPRDAASTRTVVLRRVAGEWRVAEVREGGQPAR